MGCEEHGGIVLKGGWEKGSGWLVKKDSWFHWEGFTWLYFSNGVFSFFSGKIDKTLRLKPCWGIEGSPFSEKNKKTAIASAFPRLWRHT